MFIKIRLNNYSNVEKFLKITNSFCSDISIFDGSVEIDAKSALGVSALDLSKIMTVKLISDNVDECRRFDSEMEAFRI